MILERVMPFIPIPRGHSLVQVAALAVVLTVVMLLSPVWLLCWTFPSGRELLVGVLGELHGLLTVILAPQDTPTPLSPSPATAASRRPPGGTGRERTAAGRPRRRGG